jgi:hypothetical protein
VIQKPTKDVCLRLWWAFPPLIRSLPLPSSLVHRSKREHGKDARWGLWAKVGVLPTKSKSNERRQMTKKSFEGERARTSEVANMAHGMKHKAQTPKIAPPYHVSSHKVSFCRRNQLGRPLALLHAYGLSSGFQAIAATSIVPSAVGCTGASAYAHRALRRMSLPANDS